MADNDSLRKKESNAQHIDDLGIALLNSVLPKTQKFKLKFIEQSKSDFGVDGMLQVFEDGRYANEDHKIQLKSTSSPKFINNGKTLALSLDMSSVWSYVEDMKSPIALIVADTTNNKAYWCPIQTDSKIISDLNKKLAIENVSKEQTLTIHIDTKNELRSDNYQDLCDYFRQAGVKLARKMILQDKTNKTLGTGMKFLSEIEQQTLDLDGFTPHVRPNSEQIKQGTVFSINYGADRTVDYVPSGSYRPELAPKIKFTAKFSMKTKEGRERAEAFKSLIEKGEGNVELTDENIEIFEAISGDKILGDKTYAKGGIKLSLAPALQKRRLTVFINNNKEELENIVETWYENGSVHIESIDGQPLYIATSFELKDGIKTNFKIRINSSLLKSASQELRYMDFLRGIKQIDISFLDQDGFKRKLFGGEFNGNTMISEESYQFVKALTEIEKSSGVPIPYPLPEKLKNDDIDNVFWVHRLLTQGKITQDMTFRFTLKAQKPKDLKKGGVMVMRHDPPEIYLFGEPYVMPGYKQAIQGTISELESSEENGNLKYKARIKKAEVLIEKTSNS